MKKYLSLLLLVTSFSLFSQNYQFNKLETNSTSSFRGLSVVDDQVGWISGSKGQVGRTTDGGLTWTFSTVAGHEGLDFRSLYAFDDQHAVIANAGSPAHILITSDGGNSWKQVYNNEHQDAFFDGVDFWNDKEGLIYGDPIDGKMLLLRTGDGGNTWQEISKPPLLEKGEASFAASGTGIRCIDEKKVMIATGGIVSRLWISNDKGKTWSSIATPIIQGESTSGILSFTQTNKMLIIVGGDFQRPSLTTKLNYYSLDGGKQWLVPEVPTRAYRECIERLTRTILIATGPSGTDISYDNGINWQMFSDEKDLHVVRKARKGSLVIAAGGKGQVYLLR